MRKLGNDVKISWLSTCVYKFIYLCLYYKFKTSTMKATEKNIKKEFLIIQKEIEAVLELDDTNGHQVIMKLIQYRSESDFFTVTTMQNYIEWITNQVYENNLPKDSSGSFIVALSDIDNIAAGLQIDEDEKLFAFARKLWLALEI